MLITSEFFIERYLGKEPLTLLTAPTNIDANLLAQYNTFIANIVTIYGSQNSNGTIPIFYKNANGTPNTNSTLTSLQSGQEYYFISKSTASFPYAIPAIGGSVSSPTPTPACPQLSPCCPTVFFTNNSISLSGPSENSYAYLTASVTGLIPGKKYNYLYSSLGANWPSKVVPISGSIYPASGIDTIDTVFNFCPSTGDCSGCLPFTLDCYPEQDIVKKNIYSILELSISSPDLSDCPKVSDKITVKCNQCLPTPCPINRPSLSFSGGPKLSLSPGCCTNPVPVTVNINGATPGKSYSFDFSAWPSSVQVVPSSGTSGFGDGSGKLSAMVNLNGEQNAVVRCSLTDTVRNETFVDFITIQCNTTC